MENSKNLDEFRKLAYGSGMSRREFMRRAAAAGVALSSASALWSAEALANTPQRGGHLRVGTEGGVTADSFHPFVSIGTDHVTQAVLLCFDTLTETDATGAAAPSLAESWEHSDDGKTWRFHLRKGAEFHNGQPVTADDVIWSYQLHLEEGGTCAECQQVVSNLELSADGNHTVVMEQKEVNFDLPAHLSAYGLIIGPAGTEDWNAGVGSGPYVLERWEPGQSFIGRRFDNFYRDDQGHFDSVELVNINDLASRMTALRSDAVDVIGQPDTKTARLIDQMDGFSLIEVPGGTHYESVMRCDTDPFTDNNIRLAVKYGINREEILEKIVGGFGYVGNDHPIGRNYHFFNDELPQRVYDPDRSRFHLEKAGLTEISLELFAGDGAWSGATDMALLMQSSLKSGGVNVEVNRYPADGYWSDVWMQKPWCMVYWNGRPTVDWMLSAAYISTSSWNDTFFKNERFDSILIAARTERDQDKRRQMYFDLQEILHNEGGAVIPVFGSSLMAKSDRLGHGAVGGIRRMDDARLGRRWWFA